MPYAQAHYPHENREHFETHFPADFIAEGLDQTRGWFYTLMVLSTALFDRPAFRNVIVNGLVLASDGRKMSKRLKNYPDPAKILDSYGADALRLYLMNSPVVRAEDLCFSEDGIQHNMRHLLIPLWNAYSFFVSYANIDGWTPAAIAARTGTNLLDRWILSSLESLVRDVTAAMDSYDLQRAVRPFVRFIEDLTNWYIRRSRRRFWKSQNDEDKAQAYATLYYVLLQFSKIAAPFLPFVSDSIYRNLRTPAMPVSVHLCDYPVSDDTRRDATLEKQMETVMAVVELGRQLRAAHNLKVRQPLAGMHIVTRDAEQLSRIADWEAIILDELNVKTASFSSKTAGLVTLQAKADFRKLGPRLGTKVKKAAAAISALNTDALEALAGGTPVTVIIDGEPVSIPLDEVVLDYIPRPGMVVASSGPLVVAIETALTPALIQEGLAREFVNKVQNMRKVADLELTQRIRIRYAADAASAKAIREFMDYIQAETLALECLATGDKPAGATDWDLNDHPCAIALETV
jgi:isoleucyl-tRNA synthetase